MQFFSTGSIKKLLGNRSQGKEEQIIVIAPVQRATALHCIALSGTS